MNIPIAIAIIVGMLLIIVFLPAIFEDESDVLSRNIYLSSTKVADVKNLNVDAVNNDGSVDPSSSSGGKSTAEGIDPSIEWGETSDVPDQYCTITSTYTVYKGGFYEKFRNSNGAVQHTLAKQIDLIGEGGYCYVEYNGYRYYTVALSAMDVTPTSKHSTIVDSTTGDNALVSSLGCLFKVNCDDGTEFGVLMVDAKACGDTVSRAYWGQPVGNDTCTLEFYIDGTTATSTQMQGNMATSDPTNPRYQKKIVSFQKGPCILKS